MKVYRIALKARNNIKLTSFNASLEYYLTRRYVDKALSLLITRPGEFARRLDHIMRLAAEIGMESKCVDQFKTTAYQVPTRNLVQLLGHLHSRCSTLDRRVVYPKGNVQKAIIIDAPLLDYPVAMIDRLVNIITVTLKQRFAALSPCGKTWIDPALIDCPLPAQQRGTSSNALFRVARGTRLPIDETETPKNILRLFTYWKGDIIDLSATFHSEALVNNFNKRYEHISYSHLGDSASGAYHSGDIIYPSQSGACEFIDIDIQAALRRGIRYVVMNVLVYDGLTFAQHEFCYAGWMTRSETNSNEIFDAKTVQQKIDITATSKNLIPVVFDLQERKAIWADLAMSSREWYYGNNVESNATSIEEKLEAVVTNYNRLSLYELFELHATARGELVENKEDAETIFALNEGITPFNIDIINGDYMA